MSEALNKIGRLIKNRRTELNLSVKELASKSRVGYTNIINIEEGLRDELPEDACLNGYLKILLRALTVENPESVLAEYNSARESQAFISLTNAGHLRMLSSEATEAKIPSKLNSRTLIYLLLVFIFFVIVVNSVLQNFSKIKQDSVDTKIVYQKALTQQVKKKNPLKQVEEKIPLETEIKSKPVQVIPQTSSSSETFSEPVTDKSDKEQEKDKKTKSKDSEPEKDDA